MTDGGAPPGRFAHAAVGAGETMYMVGGYAQGLCQLCHKDAVTHTLQQLTANFCLLVQLLNAHSLNTISFCRLLLATSYVQTLPSVMSTACFLATCMPSQQKSQNNTDFWLCRSEAAE